VEALLAHDNCLTGPIPAQNGLSDEYLVVNSKRNSAEFRRISDSGPFFDPISSDSGFGSKWKIRSRHRPPRSRLFYSLINFLPATNFSEFSSDFPTRISGIPESEAEIPIPDPPARGAIPAEFTTKDE
jgi:hypothetical protein